MSMYKHAVSTRGGLESMPSSLAALPKGAMPFVFSESRDISRVGGYGTINSGLRSDSSVAGSMGAPADGSIPERPGIDIFAHVADFQS
jgi:hypothetical protein